MVYSCGWPLPSLTCNGAVSSSLKRFTKPALPAVLFTITCSLVGL